MKIIYRRVSTREQNLDRQFPDLPFASNEEYKVFHDKKSGKNFEREGWKAMLDYLREGDEVFVYSLDRMGRDMLGILKAVDFLVKEKRVTLHLEKENLVLKAGEDVSPLAKMMLQMLGMFAELERNLILERQREGIEAAQARGVHCGRPAKGKADPETVLAALAEGKSVRKVAEEIGITPSMVQRIKQAHQ